VLFHRQLYQDFHNTKLRKNQEVHHLDGDKGNNCIANLQAVDAGDHRRAHASQTRVWLFLMENMEVYIAEPSRDSIE